MQDAFWGSLFGAALAFTFLRVSEYLNEYYKQKKENYCTILRLDYKLQDVLYIIDLNSAVKLDYDNVKSAMEKTTKIPVIFSPFLSFADIEEIMYDIGYNDLKNKIIRYQSEIREINLYLNNRNDSLMALRDSYLYKKINSEDYVKYLVNAIDRLNVVNEKQESIKRKTIELRDIIKDLLNKKPLFLKLI